MKKKHCLINVALFISLKYMNDNDIAMGAFRPTILPIENLQGNCVPAVFQKIQPYPIIG